MNLIEQAPGKKFQELVPVHDYNKIYEEWWKKTLEGVPDVTWPGKIKYYALSSGTSDAASKYIPVTRDMCAAIRSIIYASCSVCWVMKMQTAKAMTKGFLMLGGATDLTKGKSRMVCW